MRVRLVKITLLAAFEDRDGHDAGMEALADQLAEMVRDDALTVASEYDSVEADVPEDEDSDELADVLAQHFPSDLGANALTAEELDDLIDLLQRMIDGEPGNPDVAAWIPVLMKFQAQRTGTVA